MDCQTHGNMFGTWGIVWNCWYRIQKPYARSFQLLFRGLYEPGIIAWNLVPYPVFRTCMTSWSLILAQAFLPKDSTKIFSIIQLEKKNGRAYLKRFNKEMLHVKNMLKHITIKALINGVYNYFLWKMLYTLSNKNFLSIKHTMENYIRVEEDSMIRQGHPPFHIQVESLACHQSRTRT